MTSHTNDTVFKMSRGMEEREFESPTGLQPSTELPGDWRRATVGHLSSIQDAAYHMILYMSLLITNVVQCLKHPTGVWKVMGSMPKGDISLSHDRDMFKTTYSLFQNQSLKSPTLPNSISNRTFRHL